MCLFNCRKIKCNKPIYAYKLLRVVDNNPLIPNDIKNEVSQYINVPRRYFSFYQDFEWVENKVLNSELEKYVDNGYYDIAKNVKEIGPGFFHSFKNKESALLLLNSEYNQEDSFAVCRFEIPAESVVYKGDYSVVLRDGTYCKVASYASDNLKLLGFEIFDYEQVLEKIKSKGVYWE